MLASGGPDRNGLWFHPGSAYTEERWLDDWAMLTVRYRNCPHVVGCDLRNEVRFCPWPFRWPSWGPAPKFLGACDWAAASLSCAERIQRENPDVLIVVERIIWPMRSLLAYAADPRPVNNALTRLQLSHLGLAKV